MKKSNNKGFMLLETLITSTFVIGVLVFLYVQFANVKRSYDESFKINSVPGLYGALDLKKYLNGLDYSALKESISSSSNGYIELDAVNLNDTDINYFTNLVKYLNINKVIMVTENMDSLKTYLKDNKNVFINKYSNDFYKYINKITVSNKENSYRLLIIYNDKTFTSIVLD